MKLSWLFVLALLTGAGCKDSERAEFSSLGRAHTVTVYDGGKPVRVFHSTGNISFQEHGTMIYFMDRDTKKLVEASGTIVVEVE